MSSSTLHRPALHGSWWYIAAAAVLTAAVMVVLITAIQQNTPSGHPAVVTIPHTPYSPATRACFAGRPSIAASDLDRSLCATANR
jgi:hypothetical protein